MGLFNFKEKKLFDMLNGIKAEDLDKELQNGFFKYERLRQTWQYNPKTLKKEDLLYKIIHKKDIIDEDITRVKKEAKTEIKGVKIPENDEVLKFYISVLENMKNIGEKLLLGYENYEIVDESRIKTRSTRDKISEKSSNNEMIKRNAENLTKFFYGPNNFMQEGAKKCFKKYSKLFDLLLKCKGEAYKKVLIERKADVDTICNQERNLGLLGDLAVELYGRENKYSQKIKEFIEAFN